MLASAVALALSTPASLSAAQPEYRPTTDKSWLESQPWYEKTDFYGAFVSYAWAELAYRRFRNRHCALDGNRKESLSHVLVDTRERLDKTKQRIESLWPDKAAATKDPHGDTDIAVVDRCDDQIAANEAFGAMIATRDAAELILKMAERNLMSSKDPK